jgi:hypothetical protein
MTTKARTAAAQRASFGAAKRTVMLVILLLTLSSIRPRLPYQPGFPSIAGVYRLKLRQPGIPGKRKG